MTTRKSLSCRVSESLAALCQGFLYLLRTRQQGWLMRSDPAEILLASHFFEKNCFILDRMFHDQPSPDYHCSSHMESI